MKTQRLKLSLAVGALLALAFGSGQNVLAQQTYDPYLDVPVTFYDFHSDRTNPEFEQPHDKTSANGTDGWRRRMVDSTLDADGKPKMGVDAGQQRAQNPYLNHGVRFWFRDNQNLSQYKMASEKDPRYTNRGYLEKFRPVYMYGTNYPLTWHQTENANGYGEWGSAPTTGLNEVPYAYQGETALRAPNYTGGTTINVTAEPGGFRMNNRHYTIDTAYTNKKIDSTVRFVHMGNGRYQFNVNGGFFPLGNGGNIPHKGLTPADNWIYSGGSGSNRNYSYTMELVYEFRYEQNTNQNFTFRGDDDVWVFVKNKLVMDIGGIHEAKEESFNLDQLRTRLNLVDGERTTMNFFYVERHANDANILITTNIITTKPSSIDIRIRGDELTAGVPEPAEAYVEDNDGKRITDFTNGTFRWSAREMVQNQTTGVWSPAGNNSYNQPGTANQNANGTRPSSGDLQVWSQINKNMNKSDSIYLVANKAYTYIELTGCYTENGSEICKSDIYYVGPGPAAKLTIEASATQPANSSPNLRNPNPILYPQGIVLTNSTNQIGGFYAILRDAYGNWVGPAAHGSRSTNAWSTARNTIATAANGTSPTLGEGRATRVFTGADTTLVTVTHTNSSLASSPLTATAVINLMNVEVTNMRVSIMRAGVKTPFATTLNPNNNPPTIEMKVDEDTTLYVEVILSNNPGVWVDATAAWAAQCNNTANGCNAAGTNPLALDASSLYQYHAKEPWEINLTATIGTRSITVRINAKYNTPVAMRFFNMGVVESELPTALSSEGIMSTYDKDEKSLKSYPVPNAKIIVKAGEDLLIYTGMFATNPPTPNSYIPYNQAGGSIAWDNIPDATITPTSDKSAATFQSTVAWRTYEVVATFTHTATSAKVEQKLLIEVIPNVPTKIYIEPASQDVNPTSLNKALTFSGCQQPCNDSLELAKSEGSRQVFALLRDEWQNYVAPSGGYIPYWDNYGWGKELTIEEPPTIWTPKDGTVVTAGPGSNPYAGQGIITIVTTEDGTSDIVMAQENSYRIIQDKAKLLVKILGYSYTNLRIVEKDGDHIKNDTLKITTNDEPTLAVQGKRSDCDSLIDANKGGTSTFNPDGVFPNGCWEDVDGIWGSDPELSSSLGIPPRGRSWELNPRSTGTGNITVSRDGLVTDENGNVVPGPIYVELPTVIKLGPPTRAELVIITPPEQRKAGAEIEAEIHYYNRTGLMTEWDDSWNSDTARAAFKDDQTAVATGSTSTVKPSVTSESGKQGLGYKGYDAKINARLAPDATGKATVTFILYNAMDNPHTLSYAEAIAGKNLTATATLTLLPGDLKKVVIVDEDGKDIDSVTLDHEKGEVIVVVTVGEDEFGNRTTEKEPSKWCLGEGSAIPPSSADCNNMKPEILYDPSDASAGGCGILQATHPDLEGDELKICVKNVRTKPQYAITRDFHGCGYINAVEVGFLQKVESKKKFNPASDAGKINLRHGNTTFTCDSIYANTNKVDDHYYVVTLFLQENQTANLQTDWELTLDIDGVDDSSENGNRDFLTNVRFNDLPVDDGVAPVINTAKRYFDKSGDSTKNYIEVKFSEKVTWLKGAVGNAAQFTTHGYKPSDLFQIWKTDSTASNMAKVRAKKLSKKASVADNRKFEKLDEAFTANGGITSVQYIDNMTVRFFLENKYPIAPPYHFINIKATGGTKNGSSEVRDVLTNVSDSLNRKVAIMDGEDPPLRMVPVPNPASPDRTVVGNSEYASNGKFTGSKGNPDAYKYIGAYHNPGAIPHIRSGGGGAVFQVPVMIRDENGKLYKIKCQVKVYDLAGNLVSSGETDDMLNVPGQQLAADFPGEKFAQMNLFWSGYNSKGMKSAPGTYRIIVAISYDTKDPNVKNHRYQGTIGIAK